MSMTVPEAFKQGDRVFYRHDLLNINLPARVLRITKRGPVIAFMTPITGSVNYKPVTERKLTHKQAAEKLTPRTDKPVIV